MRMGIKKTHYVCGMAAFIFVLLCCSAGLIAAGQSDDANGRIVLKPVQQRMRTRINYSCRDLSIDTVLMQLAEQAGINIYKSPKVTGNVTVRVTDVPLEEVLGNILAAHGYTYIVSDSMIRVMPVEEVAVTVERPVTRIYRITYADAKGVSDALGKFISKEGKISYNKGTSNIIVTDLESKVRAIDSFIEEIDRITPQVLVEARIYDITTNEAFDIGVEWTAGRNTPFTTVERKVGRTRTDTTTGPTDTYETTITRTETDDPAATAPLITETVTETTRKPLTTGFGIGDTETITETDKSWLLDDEGEHLDFTRRSKPFVGGGFKPGEGGALRFGLINDMVDIEFVLNILHSELEAKLLANPRVLVLDNETANFKIVREVPYVEEAATALTTQFETRFKDVGVELQVTPHITRDGMVKLRIMPKFSVLIGMSELDAPIVDSRQADTTLLVRDGQTVVLGGLRKKETTKGVDKVPLLGDMPVLGGLFRSETETEVTSELVVFITPRIITEPVLSKVEARQFEATAFADPGPTK